VVDPLPGRVFGR